MKHTIILLMAIAVFRMDAQTSDISLYDLKYKFNSDTTVYRFVNQPVDLDSVLQGLKVLDEENLAQWAIESAYKQYEGDRYLLISAKDSLFEVFATTDSLTWATSVKIAKFYIDSSGHNYSVYLGDDIDMLCGFVFTLPDHPVRIGDTWKTNVDDIEFNGYVEMDSFLLKDFVTLEDVSYQSGEQVATVKYNYLFYFKGQFAESQMEWVLQYKATGYFNINKGIWIKYDGILSNRTSQMLPDFRLIYKLELLDMVPENLYYPGQNEKDE